MSKGNNRVKRIQTPQRILKIYCYVAICKPLNGSFGSSKGSHLLKLVPIPYTYLNKQKELTHKTVDSYLIKGLRGAVRHKVMEVCFLAGLEVCHTSDKTEDKDKNPLLPQG